MWRERIEAFWDGGSTLVVGLFGVTDLANLIAPHAEILVISYADADFSKNATLLDVIDVRTTPLRHWIVRLPPNHRHVSLLVSGDEDLRLHLVDDDAITGGEWRLLLTELTAAHKDSDFFRVEAVTARGEREQFTREEVEQ